MLLSPTFNLAKGFSDLFSIGQTITNKQQSLCAIIHTGCTVGECARGHTRTHAPVDAFEWRAGAGAGVSRELCALLAQTLVFMCVLLVVDCRLLRPVAVAIKRVYNQCMHYGQYAHTGMQVVCGACPLRAPVCIDVVHSCTV